MTTTNATNTTNTTQNLEELNLDDLDLDLGEGQDLDATVEPMPWGDWAELGVLGQAGQVAREVLESLGPAEEQRSPYELLAQYRVPVTPSEALECLSTIVEPVRLLALYKHYFPKELAESKAQLLPGPDCVYSAAEIEFFNLVNAHLFPLWDYILEWQIDEDQRDMVIPCAPQAMEIRDREADDFREGWHLLFVLEGQKAIDDLPEESPCLELREELEAYCTVLRAKRSLDYEGPFTWAQLGEIGQREGGPLVHLETAIRMIHESTGNAWLDISQELALEARDVFWTREWVDVLAEEWKEAGVMLRDVCTLIDWLEEDIENQRRVLQIWQQGLLEGDTEIALALEAANVFRERVRVGV